MIQSQIKIVIAEYETRTKKKFVRKDAAKQLGITPQYLSAVIAGKKKNIDAEMLFKLANMLECKVDDLYLYEEE